MYRSRYVVLLITRRLPFDFVCCLLQANESVMVVSERLGHSTSKLTLDTYSHVLDGMQEQAAAKLDTILRPPVDCPTVIPTAQSAAAG